MTTRGLFKRAEEDLEVYAGMRLPICLCLDVSGSMDHLADPKDIRSKKITELNKGIQEFYQELQNDEITKYTAEVAIVTFGGNATTGKFAEVKTVRDFSRVEIQGDAPVLSAYGYTPMGEAVNQALDLLEKRKKQYKDYGNTYYRPWLVIMSDGRPEGHSPAELARAKQRVHKDAMEKKVVPISVSIGRLDPEAQRNLTELGDGLCISMTRRKFLEFFRWLHKSVSSSVGNDVDTMMKELLSNAKVWSDDDFLRNL